MKYLDMYKRWLEFDEDIKKELTNLSDKDIEDRFYKELEFGTGGLRGVIGAGTNRMNEYTVRKATTGLGRYILKSGAVNPVVAIAYDSRLKSDVFAREAALVLNAMDIKTYLYSELMPTPMLSYAVRQLKANAGIVITASHNPKEYNGYKVYWSDGGQITKENASGILKEIENTDYSDIQSIEMEKAVLDGLYNYIPQYVEDDYINCVKSLVINKEMVMEIGKNIKIIYTPIHGTGNKPVRRVLDEIGFKNVSVVKEQELPDSNFSTTKYPNPEESDVFILAIELAKKQGADLIMGTDPDCDRVGVVVKDKTGEYVVLTGNQTGLLLTQYILDQLSVNNRMPENPIVVKTIVTTELSKKICENYNVDIIDVLTGFKYIGEKIKEFELSGEHSYVFGFEESYGYLAGTFARDKDAVVACTLISEMTAWYYTRSMTLYDGLLEIYNKYGYCTEDLKSLTFTGIEGARKIENIMDKLRDETPEKIGDFKVVRLKDYQKQINHDMQTNSDEKIELPVSNVIQLFLEDGSLVTARPSGTEPKIKFYFASIGKDKQDCINKISIMENCIVNFVE